MPKEFEQQFKNESLLSRREAIRDAVALAGSIGGLILGRRITTDLEQMSKAQQEKRIDRIATQMVATQELLLVYTGKQEDLTGVYTALNQLALDVETLAQRVKKLETKK